MIDDNTSLFNKNTLSNTSDLPLYSQLLTLIKEAILSGRLKPGDLLPSESELCTIYNLSRTTVRQAMSSLSDEQLIYRRRGQGTFVADQKLHRNINKMYSFTRDLASKGLTARSKIIEKKILPASDLVMDPFHLHEESKVFKLVRLRYANKDPLLLETTFIPLYLCPKIIEIDFSNESLYKILGTNYDLEFSKASESYEAINIPSDSASLLSCPTNTAGFKIQRISYLKNEVPFELTSSITRGDRTVFHVNMKADNKGVQFKREVNI